jgi:hypothetical protein
MVFDRPRMGAMIAVVQTWMRALAVAGFRIKTA